MHCFFYLDPNSNVCSWRLFWFIWPDANPVLGLPDIYFYLDLLLGFVNF